jgi:hypothetical protein
MRPALKKSCSSLNPCDVPPGTETTGIAKFLDRRITRPFSAVLLIETSSKALHPSDMKPVRYLPEKCRKLYEEAAPDDPSFRRYIRMAEAWRALADERGRLDGELKQTRPDRLASQEEIIPHSCTFLGTHGGTRD